MYTNGRAGARTFLRKWSKRIELLDISFLAMFVFPNGGRYVNSGVYLEECGSFGEVVKMPFLGIVLQFSSAALFRQKGVGGVFS